MAELKAIGANTARPVAPPKDRPAPEQPAPEQPAQDPAAALRYTLFASRFDGPAPAAPRSLEGLVDSGNWGGFKTKFDKLSRPKQLEAMEKLSPPQREKLSNATRSGEVKSKAVSITLGAELAARSTWGQGEGKATVDNFKRMYAKGRVEVSEKKVGGGWAYADPAKKGSERGVKTDSTIYLHPTLLRSPDLLASYVAHEGTHALRMKEGTRKPLFAEETDAHVAQARVWNQLSPPSKRDGAEGNYPGVSAKDFRNLRTMTEAYVNPNADAGRAAVRAQVERWYAP